METAAARRVVLESQIWERMHGSVVRILLVEGCFSQFGLGIIVQIKSNCNSNCVHAFKSQFSLQRRFLS